MNSPICCYKNVYSPEVVAEIDVYEFLEQIKNPGAQLIKTIQDARDLHSAGKKEEYDKVKRALPCYTLNFSFEGKKSNENITGSTGLIYLDVDQVENITVSHPLVFAAWRSLSGKGWGLLVKVDNLNLENFKMVYNSIGKELGLPIDLGAAKATQYNVQSYDNRIYINEESTTWEANQVSTPTSFPTIKKKERVVNELGDAPSWRYDNTGDLDFKGKEYLEFPVEKEKIADVYFPKNIRDGQRTNLLFAKGAQLRALNPSQSPDRFAQYMLGINQSCCNPPLEETKINKIIKGILKIDDPTPIPNKERRIIFRPGCNLSLPEKRSRVNRLTGALRSKKTCARLANEVYWWDYQEHGRLTQKKLAAVTGRNIKTIEKYYKDIKDIWMD